MSKGWCGVPFARPVRRTHRAGAAAALSRELVDSMALACTPAQLDGRLAAYAHAGVTTLPAVPCGPDRPAIVRALAAATVARA